MDEVSKEMLASSDKTELDQSSAVTSYDANNHSNNRCSRKSNGNSIGRRLSRRLSLVTKVPSILSASKLKQEILNTFESADFFRHDTVDCPVREIEITLITPDKRQKLVSCHTNQTIAEVTEPILQEFQLTFDSAKLFLAGSLAVVETSANVSLLVGDVLLIEHRNIPLNPIGDAEKEYRITEQLMYSEIEYVTALRSASELYDNPIQISSSSVSSLNLNNSAPAGSSSKIADSIDLHLSPVFLAFANLATSCSFLMNRIKNALERWDPQQFSLSEIFSEEFWDRYDEYLDSCKKSRQLLRGKRLSDENFVTVCRIRQGAAKYSLDSLLQLPVQRLSEYEQYFENLLAETRLENQREAEEINRIKGRCKQALKRGQRESDLERVQDLFPNDCLRLYDVDALTMKVKGLMRKRSGAAARLHRALSTKSLRSESPPPSPRSSSVTAEYRQFIMDAPVHFTAGVQSQDRHLFLFNDLLLIAKARSGGNFKLKEKVRISEIWLTKCCLDEVSELNKSEATSFVLGWPTTNVVVTFSTQAARDLWWSKLHELYHVANEKEPCTTNIQVVYYDNIKNVECCKTFCVGPEDTSRDCIRLTLEQLGSAHLDVEQFQLWAKTVREEAPYPLIGHERPFAIKLSCLRDSLSSEAGWDMNRLHNVHDPLANRCHFILKSVVKTPSSINESKKSFKKLSTRGMRISHVFRKSINNKEQSGCLFGLPLSKLSDGETLPKPVMGMLYQIFAKGPFVQGIFRKSANARLVRELREKLDSGNEDVSWEHIPVLVTAALLKDFLRSLPDPLLTTLLYPQWREAIETQNIDNKLARMKGVIAQLPKANHLLLTYFLCVLYHIARRSCHTLMSAANLGVCVGPSLLWSNCPNVSDDLRIVPAIVECLITHCEFLWGSHITSLLGDLRDSGTEESDSTKRDDSSIDSLECSPPPRKDKISLSRDSGLTMSDSQLYTPDEEESGSTSSSGYDPAFDQHSKISSSMSVPSNYVRVYGGWEQRLNPNFQRQDWFRQRSRRSNNAANSKPEVRRSASEESLLDCNKPPPPTPPRKNKPSLHDFQSTTAPTVILPYHHRHHPIIYKKTVIPPMRKVDHLPLLPSSSNAARSSEADKNADNSDRCFNGAALTDCSYSSSAVYSAMDDSQSKDDFKTVGKSTFANLSDDAYGGFCRRIARKPALNSASSCVVNRTSAPTKSNQNSNGSANVGTPAENYYANIGSLRIPADEDKNVISNAAVIGFGAGDYYYTAPSAPSVVRQSDEIKSSECEDSSTLSDDDCTPHVSRSNSRGNEVSTLRQVTPARVDNCAIRGRLKRKEERTTSSAAYRSRSVPPPPPYRPPPPATSRRAPITSYYLSANGDCDQPQKYVITRTFMDEESYV